VTYAKFLEAELKAEYDRRAALFSRAKDLTTTSGAFIALVLALVALIAGKDFKLTSGAAWVAAASLVAFFIASLFALLASIPRKYNVTTGATLRTLLGSNWKDPEIDARHRVATLNAGTIETMRKKSNLNAWLLFLALQAQVVGYVLLAVAAAVEIATIPH
jgi:hypothetical protein